MQMNIMYNSIDVLSVLGSGLLNTYIYGWQINMHANEHTRFFCGFLCTSIIYIASAVNEPCLSVVIELLAMVPTFLRPT
jgi:hypothetical protein